MNKVFLFSSIALFWEKYVGAIKMQKSHIRHEKFRVEFAFIPRYIYFPRRKLQNTTFSPPNQPNFPLAKNRQFTPGTFFSLSHALPPPASASEQRKKYTRSRSVFPEKKTEEKKKVN